MCLGGHFPQIAARTRFSILVATDLFKKKVNVRDLSLFLGTCMSQWPPRNVVITLVSKINKNWEIDLLTASLLGTYFLLMGLKQLIKTAHLTGIHNYPLRSQICTPLVSHQMH